MAEEADHRNEGAARCKRKRLVLDRAAENAAQTEGREGDDVVGKDQDQVGDDAGNIGEVGKAEHHFNDAHGKAGKQTPFHAVAIADDDDGQLREERDRAAVGEFDGRELVEYDSKGKHDAAFCEPLDGRNG